jgi:site-specific DNA recombinase
MVVAIYVRISQENPDGYSLADQEQRCRIYAEEQGWQVIKVYVDDGVSGRRWDRPALQRMIAELQPLGVGTVIVYDLDRAMRRLRYQIQLKDELDVRHVSLVSLADGVIDTSTPEGILRFHAKGMVNEYQANTTARKVRDNLAYKAKHGGWVGQWPIGYEKESQGRLVPSVDAPVVQLIFVLYASGKYTDATIADELNARGYQTIDTKTGKRGRFERESVRTILKNRAYLGYVSSGGEEYPGQHEPLISEELWAAAQTIRETRTRSHGSPILTEAAWLNGHVWCEECKNKIWHQKSGRQANVRYYRCSGINKRTCHASMVQAQTLEGEMLDLLGMLVIPPDIAGLVADEARRLGQAPPATVPSTDSTSERKLIQLQQAYDADILTRAEFDRKRKALLTTAHLSRTPAALNGTRVLAMLADIPTLMAAATPSERRAVVGALFDKVWIQDKGIIAVTPRADVGPVLAGLAQIQYGCLDGVPDGPLPCNSHITNSALECLQCANAARIIIRVPPLRKYSDGERGDVSGSKSNTTVLGKKETHRCSGQDINHHSLDDGNIGIR